MKSIDKFVLVLVASLALLLAGCGGGSSTPAEPPGPTPEEMAAERAQMQTAAIMTASGAVNTALGALSGSEPTQDQIDDVNTAISGLQAALSAAADVSDAEKAGYQAQVTTAQATVMQAQATLMAMQDAAAEAARMAMAAMTAKLWAGIGEDPLSATTQGSIAVATTGVLTVTRVTADTTDTDPTPALAENKDATVASLHGWAGSEHTAKPDGDGTYTARLYSNVGEPTQGAKFNSGITGITETSAGSGVYTVAADAANAGRVASPQFDHSAGTKVFKLPEDNPSGATRINIPGSYYGVSGTYTCTTSGTDTCTAVKASGEGYTLGVTGSAAWTFKPSNPEARVTEMPDMVYAVYGWWLHETAGGTATVSAFSGYRGTEDAENVGTLLGSATYSGGAAGKYAISAGTTNDSGHFTADAELKADFDDDTITGTINNFMGGDGMARDWSVSLEEQFIGDTGLLRDAADAASVTATDPGAETIWTMGGTAASESGNWIGSLHDNNDGGVPSVGVGTFHSEFGNTGRMVGAFGVNLEE